ncbi:unnamed protein product [Ambrosiozyma monospora]|uniref:Unnamed protein product n=1 Tax=Ambrosiozyma monospora TaxID=43982 RepID=A0ACB5TCZ3_AMBMO|nr:unnamed protein product [Ambrosiozyma monospora]
MSYNNNRNSSRAASRSNTMASTTSMGSRTPSGPMTAATMVMNKQANYQDSLYYIALATLKRLEKVPDMGPYLQLAFVKAEESSEQQAMALASKDNKNNNSSESGSGSGSSRSSEPLLGHWHNSLYTFAAGILPAQINYDPVTPLWKLFQQGAPLCLIFNCLSPENAIQLVSSDDLKTCKKSVYMFVSACKAVLNVRDDELFTLTSVFSDDTSSLMKVIRSVNLILDLDSRFDAPPIEDNNLFNVSDSRAKIVKEFVETERKFVQDLEILYQFREELIKAELLSSENINLLFPNLHEILDFQRRFLVGLECNASVPSKYQRIGSIFLHAGAQGFKIYTAWALSQNTAIELVNKEVDNLRKSSSVIGSPYELQSFLIKPIQRLCKYPLLLKQLLKHTDKIWPNYNELFAAHELSKEVANDINEAQRRSENNKLMRELEEKVIEWKGHSLRDAGELLFANLAYAHSTDREKEKEV